MLIASCDKIIPGTIMAAGRLNVPAIIVTGGPMMAGRHRGKDICVITMGEAIGACAIGKISQEELAEMDMTSDHAIGFKKG